MADDPTEPFMYHKNSLSTGKIRYFTRYSNKVLAPVQTTKNSWRQSSPVGMVVEIQTSVCWRPARVGICELIPRSLKSFSLLGKLIIIFVSSNCLLGKFSLFFA